MTTSATPATALTERLRAAVRGEQSAADELVPLLYVELRRLAARAMRHDRRGQTLQPTALVHEAWLRLVPAASEWQGRAHFFGAAARAMRRILVERARRRKRLRHGGEMQRHSSPPELAAVETDPAEVLALDEAMTRLEQKHERPARVVQLRYFAGLSIEEVAELLGSAVSTINADWAFARAWLRRELLRGCGSDEGT